MAHYIPNPEPLAPDLLQRRAIVPIGAEMLRDMFGLPEGMRVVGVFADPRSCAIILGVVSPDLPIVDDATEAPLLPLEGYPARSILVDVDGTLYYRFGWEHDADLASEMHRFTMKSLSDAHANLARFLAGDDEVTPDVQACADSILTGDFLTAAAFKAKYMSVLDADREVPPTST